MRLVRRRQMFGQRVQIQPLVLEQPGGNDPRLGQHAVLHPLGGPLAGLLVEIFQAVERAAGKEVRFHAPEAAFIARFPVRMVDRMTDESEAVALGEGFHLRNDDRAAPRAAQASQIRVVNDAALGRVAPEHQRLVQKALHREAVEDAIELQVPPLRVPQVDQAGDQQDRLFPELHPVERRIMLHLGSRLVGHAVATHRLAAAQFQLAQHPRQRRVTDPDAVLLDQLLADPLHPAIALEVETFQQLGINLPLVAPFPAGGLSLLLDDPSHGVSADVQAAADLPQRHPLLMHLINGNSHVRFDHRTPPSS